jgi:heptosyltransferase I
MAAASAYAADSSASPPRRILIVLLGAIGDVVRALPLLGRLRKAYPDAHIAWAVEPKSEPILRSHPWLDEIIVHNRSRAPFGFIPFLIKVRAGRFDLVLDLQRHLKSGITALASGAADRIGFASGNAKEFNPIFSTRRIAPQPAMRLKLMQYQAFGDALGIAPAPIEFGLTISDGEMDRAKSMLAGFSAPRLAVILGSSWPSRVYFPELIAATIRALSVAANGGPALFPVLIGGPEEASLAAQVVRDLEGTPVLNLAGRSTLRDLIGIFPQCAAAFAPDSGPMHIAAAVGCPVVSIWGATAPERSAPWGFADFALRGEIPCHPCYLRECPIGRECMRRIRPEDIAAAVRRALATSAAPELSRDSPEDAH